MSITTETPRQAGPRVVRPSARPSRRRVTPARRHYVYSTHVHSTRPAATDSCVEERGADQNISWPAAVAGVVGTAVVILALVGLANMRAAQLEPVSAPASSSVEHAVPSAAGE
ncbi:hypothetical protein [Rhodococcoides kyotonense]|uniref:Uncharacterized protein n=1 Tax=Rhodococcoides kyotonense TaxID=398843 RepID=A0A239D1G1_9NOCA|nr:hypothetical protein [Rhodococcus kyotonensis]SNS25711.1 hypothetical protein SAMN05421642_101309 [Rhodococcus kyotonensis]